MNAKTLNCRKHPELASVFQLREGRHLSDEDLDLVLRFYPQLSLEVETARAIRECASGVVKRVVQEIFAQYPYEQMHENALAKCPRDIGYVVAYAVQAMLSADPEWFDNKVLVWLKTILQSFDFPERTKSSAQALFSDPELEEHLRRLPKRSRSTFHTYYRLKQEMEQELYPEQADCIAPFLQQALDTLTEAY